ncbi:hypothetical protein [Streptomyces luteireticuli]|uniref:hypothetical protein n=1 Tax=Streptomyces luteireticuli TaxID=173858 RepID=UPI003558CCDD
MKASEAERMIKSHRLSKRMIEAIRTGNNDRVVICSATTERALISRQIIHPVNSNLTQTGKEILAALQKEDPTANAHEEGFITPTPQAPLVGEVIRHAGTSRGSLPHHANHPDVRATLKVLATLQLANCTEDTDISGLDGMDATVQGVFVTPRGEGRVAVYWAQAGSCVGPHREPHRAELRAIADTLRDAGWQVERGNRCVFTNVPPQLLKLRALTHGETATESNEPGTS